ncbi:MAG: Stp1/IreP family PP2C-type Ser/Thr phosphatase [Acidobacteriota bacterium]
MTRTLRATHPDIDIELFASTDVGRVRKNNEDNFLVAHLGLGISGLSEEIKRHKVSPQGTLLLVSDGMGGAQAGEVASQMAVDCLYQRLRQQYLVEETETRLLAAIKETNLAIRQAARTSSRQTGMGATLTALIVTGNKAYIAAVGDSRAYVVRAGTITQLTKDQSMVQRLIDQGLITAKQATRHPSRNIILQALGSQRKVNVALTIFELCQNDILLLCTDGLTSKVADEEIKDIILGSISVESACCNLIETANRQGGDDNITVVIAKFTGKGLLPAQEELDITDCIYIDGVLEGRMRRSIVTQDRINVGQLEPVTTVLKKTENREHSQDFEAIEPYHTNPWKVFAILALISIIIFLLIRIRI